MIKLKILQDEPISLQILDKHGGGTPQPTDPYIGPYDVTPAISEQLLYTKNKSMVKDVTVKGIPYLETTTAGTNGKTITIAS